MLHAIETKFCEGPPVETWVSNMKMTTFSIGYKTASLKKCPYISFAFLMHFFCTSFGKIDA